MLNGPLAGKILLFAMPLAFSGILQQLFNAADVAVAGRFARPAALAAVGSNAPIVSLLVNTFVGLSVGANAVIARSIGAKHEESAKRAVHTSMAIALTCGVLVAVVGNLVARPLLTLLGVPAEVFNYSLTYLRIYFTGINIMNQPIGILIEYESTFF